MHIIHYKRTSLKSVVSMDVEPTSISGEYFNRRYTFVLWVLSVILTIIASSSLPCWRNTSRQNKRENSSLGWSTWCHTAFTLLENVELLNLIAAGRVVLYCFLSIALLLPLSDVTNPSTHFILAFADHSNGSYQNSPKRRNATLTFLSRLFGQKPSIINTE